jgi:eukaryotic-like serine/threonine-protein kinase
MRAVCCIGSNVLVENGTAKLGDFGLATDNLVLGYGSQPGYSDHLAVEIWQGEGTSKTTDIWALGMTVYRLLHGAEWYSRSVKPRCIIANGGFANSLKWLPHVPKRWRTVIRKMMADDPRQRCQNAEEMLAALGTLDNSVHSWQHASDTRISWRTGG